MKGSRSDTEDNGPSLSDLEQLLDERVRPSLLAHDGDLVIKSFEDGVLRVRMLGKCSGCPAAQITNEELIRAEVQNAFPSVKDVLLVEEISQDLLDMAKKILRHEA